jgi:thymidylate synthase (FAD)
MAIDAMETTNPNSWRSQSVTSRQGSADVLSIKVGRGLSRSEATLQKYLKEVYRSRLKVGVAREQARKDLPLSTYTEAYWKIDLHNLLRFLALRMATSAQFEIRAYATLIYRELVTRWCPIVAEAFNDYQLQALKFSKGEIDVLLAIQNGSDVSKRKAIKRLGWTQGGIENSELRALRIKANLLGIDISEAYPTNEGA